MKHIMLILAITLGLNCVGFADSNLYQKRERNVKPMTKQKIKQLDRKLTKHKAVKMHFKTKKEFLRKKGRRMKKTLLHTIVNTSIIMRGIQIATERYGNMGTAGQKEVGY